MQFYQNTVLSPWGLGSNIVLTPFLYKNVDGKQYFFIFKIHVRINAADILDHFTMQVYW